MTNSIAAVSHDRCCGCMACGDSCHKGAISFTKDNEGFIYPVVGDGCIDCGICAKVCPELHPSVASTDFSQEFVGCLDRDKCRRDSGSSGGVFGLLASSLLDSGYAICGAAFDEGLQLRHKIIYSRQDLEALKKSKYLQSDSGGVYKQIKKILHEKSRVMFVGTPCQCAALKNYLGGKDEGLLLVDFACHGVPSQDLFDRCLRFYETKHRCKVLSYTFRHKTKRYGSPQNYSLSYSKYGKIGREAGPYYKEPFYCGFQKYMTLRPSCYMCRWAKTERISDLTLADFWGIEKVTDKWDRTDHPSLVIINTEKGGEAFDLIKNEIDFLITSKELAVKGNGSLQGPTPISQERETFFHDLESLPFDIVVKKHLMLRKVWIKSIYYAIPFGIRKGLLKLIN